jgi:transcriptional regulator GlxA family with amidase domain
MTRHQDFLSEALPCSHGSDDEGDPGAAAAEKRKHHPKVAQAIEYIEAHLADPGLSVRKVARHLELHADYLSNLFAGQTGQRMVYYIATRRTERAKNLLKTTPWRVKRIASECGFANPNWFCRVFGAQTGTTPSAYRNGHNNAQQVSTTGILDSLSSS